MCVCLAGWLYITLNKRNDFSNLQIKSNDEILSSLALLLRLVFKPCRCIAFNCQFEYSSVDVLTFYPHFFSILMLKHTRFSCEANWVLESIGS